MNKKELKKDLKELIYSRRDIREILRAIKKYCRKYQLCKGCYYDKICDAFHEAPKNWKI